MHTLNKSGWWCFCGRSTSRADGPPDQRCRGVPRQTFSGTCSSNPSRSLYCSPFHSMEHSLIRPLGHSITLRCATRQSSRKPTSFLRYNSTISEASPKQTLTWPEYLAIRGGRRKWQTVSRNTDLSPLPAFLT